MKQGFIKVYFVNGPHYGQYKDVHSSWPDVQLYINDPSLKRTTDALDLSPIRTIIYQYTHTYTVHGKHPGSHKVKLEAIR
ncbi:hypothetical protein LCGC14_2403870 [marine sediment metagenome]|uniref:Uncharacterized protein n=1 Tax=marine sediment metagenome TaxID=412755 RepID=A0A0F9ENX2_9ZZZZ